MKFVHAADLHLGAPFKGLRSASGPVADALAHATYRAFDKVLDLAVQNRVCFVLFGGDIYDSEDRNLRAQFRFREGLRRLHDTGIAACVIHGNHDHMAGVSAALDWPPNTHVFPAAAADPYVVSRDGEDAAIYGYSYPRREMKQSILSYYRPRPGNEGAFRIGLLHGNVGGDPNHDNYAPCSPDDLVRLGFDYWALGHVHTYKEIRAGHPAIVYPGSLQGLSARETGAHGCCLVESLPDRSVQVQFVPTDSIRWCAMDVGIDSMASLDDLLSEVNKRLSRRVETEGCSVIARVRLVGRGPLHSALKRQETADELVNELRAGGAGDPFAWINEIIVETRPDVDIDQLRAAQDSRGDFLRLCQDARDDPAQRHSLMECLQPLFERRDLHGILPDPADRMDAWIDRAEAVGLDLLLGDEAT